LSASRGRRNPARATPEKEVLVYDYSDVLVVSINEADGRELGIPLGGHLSYWFLLLSEKEVIGWGSAKS
jgi:hypothetical protein